MEDAIDDWLLRQIHWLRKEETVAQGIRWIQDVRTESKLISVSGKKKSKLVFNWKKTTFNFL